MGYTECGGGVDGGTKIETLNEKSCRWMTDVRWVVSRWMAGRDAMEKCTKLIPLFCDCV